MVTFRVVLMPFHISTLTIMVTVPLALLFHSPGGHTDMVTIPSGLSVDLTDMVTFRFGPIGSALIELVLYFLPSIPTRSES